MLANLGYNNTPGVVNALVLRHTRLVPEGAVQSYAGTVAPAGWLLCQGQEISIATYPKLYSVIGTTYGVGSAGNFILPDMRSRFPLGLGQGAGLSNRVISATGGEETHTLTTGEMPSHSHGVTDPGHTHSYVNNVNNQDTDNAFSTETAADNADISQTTGSSTTGITINNSGGGGAHNNMPPYIVINYIIKY